MLYLKAKRPDAECAPRSPVNDQLVVAFLVVIQKIEQIEERRR